MEKLLKSSARVPAHLYVKRTADMQLLKVIKEMLRPGYISVARQMGKTNLLQNAKRELQGDSNIIIYLDLSASRFENSRQYFRLVIDTILEVHDDLLYDIKNIINDRRKESAVSASIEHDRELRLILKSIRQNLIIILDEVDALANLNFSDEIFAQVRSIYFMRDTHASLERLTYILSGVIEPTKLIKNKENSPFNIAEQIYLDDFSYRETASFIEKSGLGFDDAIIDELYEWTNGNPRMTYEVCSNLEDIYLQSGVIHRDDVERVIKNLYLTDFNAAPIDHIRDIVINNLLIREAIISIRKGAPITDELKNQLYLYGIIGSKSKSAIPQIKNRVIDLALSQSWLIDISTKTSGFYEFGLEKIASGDYEEGINLVLRYAESPEITEIQRNSAYFSISDAYSRQGDYANSNSYIHKATFDKKKRAYEYYFSLQKQSINYYQLKLYDKSFECLNEIIKESSKDSIYYNAVVNNAIYRLNFDYDKNVEYTLRELTKVIDELRVSRLSEDYVNTLISLCHLRIAQIHSNTGLKEEAYSQFQASLVHAIPELKPAIFVGLIQSSTENERTDHVQSLVSSILNEKLTLNTPSNILSISFNESDLYPSLFTIFEYASNEFSNILPQLTEQYYGSRKESHVLIHDVAYNHIAKKGVSDAARELLTYCLSYEGISTEYIAKCLNAISYVYLKEDTYDYLIYASKGLDFSKHLNRQKNIEYLELIAYISAAIGYHNLGQYDYSLEFIASVLSRLDEKDEKSLAGDLIAVYYLKASILAKEKNIHDFREALAKAYSLIPLWDRSTKLLATNIDLVDRYVFDIRRAITAALPKSSSRLNVAVPAVSNKIYRNTIVTVKFPDGRTETGKFKKFQVLLESKKCVLTS